MEFGWHTCVKLFCYLTMHNILSVVQSTKLCTILLIDLIINELTLNLFNNLSLISALFELTTSNVNLILSLISMYYLV